MAFSPLLAAEPAGVPYSLAFPLATVALGTLIYLLIDVYLSTKSFRGIPGCGPFWLLYLVFCIFGLIAFGALQVAAGDKMLAFVGHPQLAGLLHSILAVGGALTVFQSFSLKLSDFKVMDVGQFVDQFRNEVKAAITDRAAKIERAQNLKTIERLAAGYKARANDLLGPLNSALASAGLDAAAIGTEIQAIQNHCTANKIDLSRCYAQKLVLVDADYADTL